MKKLLFIAAGLGAGGAERQITTVACLMKQAGYDVIMYCWNDENFFDSILNDSKIPIIREVANGFKRLLNVRSFIRNNKFDVVISFLPTPNFCNEIASLGGRQWRVIIGERSAAIRKAKTLKDVIFNYCRNFADVQVCNSNNAKELWSEVYPESPLQLKTIYNAVSIGKVTEDYYPLKNGKLHVLIVASIYKTKNPFGLLEAIKLMSNFEKNKLVIDWYGNSYAATGDKSEYFHFVNEIKECKLEDVIVLHPATNDVANTIQRADVVALFSKLEGLPNAICEGMMVGKPIIMTRISDYNTIVDETNGYLCDWDDAKSIKNALLNAANLLPDELIKMGKASKMKANNLFSATSISKKWIDLIENKYDEE